MEEIFCSGDSCFISQFFYASDALSGGKVFAGPVWDFDHAIGTPAAWAFQNPTGFYAYRLHVKDGFDTPWFYNLYQKKEFYEPMTALYQSDYLPLLDELIKIGIDQYASVISVSSVMNQIRWNISQDVLSEAAWMKQYLSERVSFLSDTWIGNVDFYQVRLDQGFGAFYGYFAVEPGKYLIELPVFEDTETMRFVGWYREDTNEPFDIAQPIYEDINIYAKWQDKPSRMLESVSKLIPLGIIGFMFIIIFFADIRRTKRNR